MIPNDLPSEKQIKFAKSLNINANGMTRKELSKAIDSVLTKHVEADDMDKPEVVKVGYTKPANKNTTMYVSYAKDIFNNFTQIFYDKQISMPHKELMEISIALVKQAKEAFE